MQVLPDASARVGRRTQPEFRDHVGLPLRDGLENLPPEMPSIIPMFLLAARRFSRLIKHASREKRRRSGSLSAVAERSRDRPAPR